MGKDQVSMLGCQALGGVCAWCCTISGAFLGPNVVCSLGAAARSNSAGQLVCPDRSVGPWLGSQLGHSHGLSSGQARICGGVPSQRCLGVLHALMGWAQPPLGGGEG